MYVSNHIGLLDTFAYRIYFRDLVFAPKSELLNIPMVGTILIALGSFFIDRSNKGDYDSVINQIAERQKAIEVDCLNYRPLIIFPEGTATNS